VKEYGEKFSSQFLRGARKQVDRGFMHQEAGRYTINPEWWLITDHILRELFID
jgi:hypothetical protein